jgi:hypothetical protein
MMVVTWDSTMVTRTAGSRRRAKRMRPLLDQALTTLSVGGTEVDDLVGLILDEILAPEYLRRAETGARTEVELASLRAGLTHTSSDWP